MAYKDGTKTVGGKTYSQHSSLKKFIRERDNHTCQLCGQPGDIVDHIIPWAISHDSSTSNLRAACFRCNVATRRKRENHSLPIAEWYHWLEQELVTPFEVSRCS